MLYFLFSVVYEGSLKDFFLNPAEGGIGLVFFEHFSLYS